MRARSRTVHDIPKCMHLFRVVAYKSTLSVMLLLLYTHRRGQTTTCTYCIPWYLETSVHSSCSTLLSLHAYDAFLLFDSLRVVVLMLLSFTTTAAAVAIYGW